MGFRMLDFGKMDFGILDFGKMDVSGKCSIRENGIRTVVVQLRFSQRKEKKTFFI
jgi:hypothetical protein